MAERLVGAGQLCQQPCGRLARGLPLQHRGRGVRRGQGVGEWDQVGGDVSVVDSEELADAVAGLAARAASGGVKVAGLPAASAGVGPLGLARAGRAQASAAGSATDQRRDVAAVGAGARLAAGAGVAGAADRPQRPGRVDPACPSTVDTDAVMVGLALGAGPLPAVGRCRAAGPQLAADRASHRTVLLLATGAAQRLPGGGAAGVERLDPATPVAGTGGPGAAALADRPVRPPAGDRGDGAAAGAGQAAAVLVAAAADRRAIRRAGTEPRGLAAAAAHGLGRGVCGVTGLADRAVFVAAADRLGLPAAAARPGS